MRETEKRGRYTATLEQRQRLLHGGWGGDTAGPPRGAGPTPSSSTSPRRPGGQASCPRSHCSVGSPGPAGFPFVTSFLKRSHWWDTAGGKCERTRSLRLPLSDTEVVPSASEKISPKLQVEQVTPCHCACMSLHHGTGNWRAWAKPFAGCAVGPRQTPAYQSTEFADNICPSVSKGFSKDEIARTS